MKRTGMILLTALLLTGCGAEQDENTAFFKEVNAFCDKIVEIDESINDISNDTQDAEGLTRAKEDLLSCLDQLNTAFQGFAAMDFPEEFDYLEDMSDEARDYMTEAVESYHSLYDTEDGYNVNMEEYADENYARAYKRIKIIVALLRGETPDEEGLTIQ